MQVTRIASVFVLWVMVAGSATRPGFGAPIPFREPTGKNLEQAITEAAYTTNGIEMRDAKGLVFSASDFRPELVDVETGKKLKVEYEATIPYYEVTLDQNAKNGGLVARTEAGNMVFAAQAKGKAKANRIALVEERYWEEFQLLQKHKELYPNINWCKVPESLRYKMHEWKTIAAPPELMMETHNNSESEISETNAITQTAKRTAKRTTSFGGASIAFLHLLLLTAPDSDNDGLSDWWEWGYWGSLQYGPDDDENDHDGLVNRWECLYASSPLSSDSDGDSLTDYQEVNVYHTQPSLADSDFDGLNDNIDPYPTTYASYLFGEITNDVPRYDKYALPANQWGYPNPVFITNIPVTISGLPSGSVVTQTMLRGFIDDAIKASNLCIKCYAGATNIDWTLVPSTAVNRTNGSFTLQLYDWIPPNYGYTNNDAALHDVKVKTKFFCSVQLVTETMVSVPANRNRTRVGVGEVIELTVHPTSLSSISWSISGGGSLSTTSGNPVTFTAPDRATDTLITANYGNASCSVTFNIVEPSGGFIEQEIGTGIWHVQGRPSVGFKGATYYLPADVSFYNIETQEGAASAVATGYFAYQNGQTHQQGLWLTVGDVIAGKGSLDDSIDTIQADSDNHKPYEAGSFTWAIPWSFRVGAGTPKVFTIVNHQKTIDSSGKLTISKGGTTKSAELNAPTSNY